MNSPEATVILRSPDSGWTAIGSDTSRGIVPEGITVTANEFGPDTCSFSLRREASVSWPDLLAFNQADVLIGGTLVWGGRIWEAPLSDGDEDVIAVQGRGWQYHLDDDLLSKYYVHADLGAWRNMRDAPLMQLSTMTANGVVTADGVVTIGWAQNTLIQNATGVGVTLDLGPGRAAKRIVVTFEAFNTGAWASVYARTHDTSDAHSGSTSDAFVTVFNAITSPASGTFANPYRYVSLFLYRQDGLSTVTTSDNQLRITSIKVFTATAYESGGASVLKASQVVADVLTSGSLPLLDPSTASIGTTAFSIPEFAPSGYQTPRALMAAANAYEGNLFGVDAQRKVFLRERDENPLTEVGSWPGSSFQDASTNSGDGLYNRVVVQGTGPAGEPLTIARLSADAASVPSSAFADVGGVANPSFETDLSSWTTITGTIVRDPTVGAEGTASARLASDAVGRASMSTTLTNLTVGAVHALRFQYRNSGGSPQPQRSVVGSITSGGVTLNQAGDDSGSITFVPLQVSFIATATTATFTFTASEPFVIAANIMVYLDGVHAYKVSSTLLDRQGFSRTAVLSVDAALTQTAAAQLGDIWLNERVNPPLKGSLVVSQGGARLLNGGEVHPSEFLLRGGQLVRLGQLVDPATGDQGRDGIIRAVSYSHDTETASLELDSERGRLETLLSRLAVVTSQIR